MTQQDRIAKKKQTETSLRKVFSKKFLVEKMLQIPMAIGRKLKINAQKLFMISFFPKGPVVKPDHNEN